MILISDKYVWELDDEEVERLLNLKERKPDRQIFIKQLNAIKSLLLRARKVQEIPALLRGALGSGI